MVRSNFAFFLTTGRCRGARHGSARPRARPCRAAAGRLLQQLLQFFFKPRLSPSSAFPSLPPPSLAPQSQLRTSTTSVPRRAGARSDRREPGTRRPGSGCCRGRGGGGGFRARLSRGAADELAAGAPARRRRWGGGQRRFTRRIHAGARLAPPLIPNFILRAASCRSLWPERATPS